MANEGSAAAAARLLGVSNATVLRRIGVIESAIGAPLFDRLPTGYLATDAGLTLALAGQSISEAIVEARLRIEGAASQLSGSLKFTTTDSLAFGILPPILRSFRAKYPAIQVEVLVTNSTLDLDRRDAEVTLRPSAHPPETWVGMRLLRMDFAVYASPDYLEGRATDDWKSLDWLLPEGTLSAAPSGRWLSSVVSDECAALKVNSFLGLQAAARAGMGAALLPRFLGESMPDLQRLAPAPDSASVDVWLLTHPNLRQSARVQAFLKHVAEGVRAQRAQFEAPDAEP